MEPIITVAIKCGDELLAALNLTETAPHPDYCGKGGFSSYEKSVQYPAEETRLGFRCAQGVLWLSLCSYDYCFKKAGTPDAYYERLGVYVGIPAGYTLRGDATPLGLLVDVQKLFVDACLTPMGKAGNRYAYTPDDRLTERLAALLKGYPLVVRDRPVQPMSGAKVALLTLPKKQWYSFFRTIEYSRYAAYAAVIMAEHGRPVTASHAGAGSRSSRPSRRYDAVRITPEGQLDDVPYTLYVNGKETAWPVSDPYSQPVRLTRTDFDVRCFDADTLSFRLSDLIDGRRVPGVRLGDDRRVDCTIPLLPKTVIVNIVVYGLSGSSDNQSFLGNLHIVDADTGRHMTLTEKGNGSFGFCLIGSDITSRLHAICDDPRFRIVNEPKTPLDGNIYKLLVTKNAKPVSPPAPEKQDEPKTTSLRGIALCFVAIVLLAVCIFVFSAALRNCRPNNPTSEDSIETDDSLAADSIAADSIAEDSIDYIVGDTTTSWSDF